MVGQKVIMKFHGRDEVLNIVNSGGELVSFLSSQTGECPLIGSDIELLGKLGEGSYGAAFSVRLKGMGAKEYVAKRMNIDSELEKFNMDRPRPLREVAEVIEKITMVSAGSIIAANGGDPDRIYTPDENGNFSLYKPYYASICKTNSTMKIPRSDGSGVDVTIPKGSYLCENNQYSEYINGVLCGDLYRNGTSANFIDVFDFMTCPEGDVNGTEKEGHQYIFMEKIDSSYDNWGKCISSHESSFTMIEVFYIQILHAIATYQKTYQLQHNDLHTGNVFIERITPETVFKGQNLNDAEWFHYTVGKVDLYLPCIPILAKIGDFGLAVKYSHPIVGDKESAMEGYDQDDGDGPWIPNWYTESYDMLTISSRIYEDNPNNRFIIDIMKWILGSDDIMSNFLSTGRPKLSILSGLKNASPLKVLTNKKLMGKYMTKPTSGKIVTLGNI